MADVIHTTDSDVDRGSGAALGVILGILLVLALLIGGYFLFFRGGAANTAPNTTIIEQESPQPAPDVNVQPPANEGDTNINVTPDSGTGGGTGGTDGGTQPAPTTP